ELYNLANDLGEKTNLATQEPERTKALHDRLVAWRKEVNAPMPTPHAPETARAAKGGKKGGKNNPDAD
ncbi:MAG TPA: aryl-sulfate sulfohydrolase, partial [Verrucomicrobium sp.]|nr:aryl-sulfate sulfohydrolase [Verrucomicrobium sp.]